MDDDAISRIGEAAVSVASHLDLAGVLQQAVETAAVLLDARYAALGVIGKDDALAQFVHTGFDGDIEAIGHTPRGEGILGLLIHDAQPLRLDDLTEHPAAVGFPEGHPAMHSFVGVPVRVRDLVYGNLYVTEKRGGARFTQADQQLAEIVAAAAGAAIDNAKQYAASRRRERSLDALREVSGEILGAGGGAVLQLIAQRALDLTDGMLSVVCVTRPATSGSVLDIVAAAGQHSGDLYGALLPADDSLAGQVTMRQELIVTDALPEELATGVEPDQHQRLRAIGAPLVIRGEPYGALIVCVAGADDEMAHLLQTFANHAGVIVEYGRARAELERLLLIEERERIGRDLHDTVIQRLFATGLELQALASRHEHDEHLNAVLGRAIDGLDDTIGQIRATIFALQPPLLAAAEDGVISAERVHALALRCVAESVRALGFEPDVVLPNDPETPVPTDIATHLLVVLREALSNVARHAGATEAQVEIELAEEFVVRVRDNGVGLPTELPPGGNGLQNLSHRARTVGGDFAVAHSVEGGTLLEWRARRHPRASETHGAR